MSLVNPQKNKSSSDFVKNIQKVILEYIEAYSWNLINYSRTPEHQFEYQEQNHHGANTLPGKNICKSFKNKEYC